MKKKIKKSLKLFALIFFLIGLCLPQYFKMPVKGATSSDYNHNSFWYYPWGKSITHKGVDIFASKETPITSATKGIVIFTGYINKGGNIVVILGPKWRLHYYAHLSTCLTKKFSIVTTKSIIGKVGNTGNAKGKQPHLHYSIFTLIPYVWNIDKSKQGWKKMFYLNPITYLTK